MKRSMPTITTHQCLSCSTTTKETPASEKSIISTLGKNKNIRKKLFSCPHLSFSAAAERKVISFLDDGCTAACKNSHLLGIAGIAATLIKHKSRKSYVCEFLVDLMVRPLLKACGLLSWISGKAVEFFCSALKKLSSLHIRRWFCCICARGSKAIKHLYFKQRI